MKRILRRWIKGALRPLGVQLVAAHDYERQALVDLLHARNIGQVIDVGPIAGGLRAACWTRAIVIRSFASRHSPMRTRS